MFALISVRLNKPLLFTIMHTNRGPPPQKQQQQQQNTNKKPLTHRVQKNLKKKGKKERKKSCT